MRKTTAALAAAALGAVLALAGGEAEARAKYNFNLRSQAAKPALLNLQSAKPRKVKSAGKVRHAPRKVARRAGYNACRAAARKFGVPLSTALAVCRLESGFRCSAVGRAGELGLLQIKLATARALGYRGSRRGLLNCSTGAYWGMKHLAMAIRRGGVWKHNAGLYAKRPNAMARRYARKVAALRRLYR